jgi:hypothetical protein
MAPSFQWWAKESHRGTPVVVKMENPNWSMVELEGPSEDDFLITTESPGSGRTRDKGHRGRKNAKQLTWVLLLKAHRAAGCLTSIASAMFGLAALIRRRLASGRTDSDENENDNDDNDVVLADGVGREKENPTVKTRFYFFIKMFLWLSVILLGFEIAAYYKGWHFGAPKVLQFQLQSLWATPLGVKGIFDWIYSRWVFVRVEYLAPPLQFLANACIVLFLIQSVDRLVLCLGCFYIKFKKIKPVPKQDQMDLEAGDKNGYFPMVLVQIPMCNEKEVILSFKLQIVIYY